MKMRVFAAMAVAVSLAVGTSRLGAQGNSTNVHIPDSSIEKPGDEGNHAHTNHVISLRSGKHDQGNGPLGGLSPEQAWNAYNVTANEPGGLGTIAIIDAFDYPTAVSDFNAFSDQFNLPKVDATTKQPLIEVAYPSGQPAADCGWAQEAALDIEWAHAMAPHAKIVLVLAMSNSFSDLFAAVNYAETLPGIGQISMSWGGGEFALESSYDSNFDGNVTYIASSGDTGGKTNYPGVSPKVVAAGGTSLVMNNNLVVSETGWSGSGGGASKYESRPSFQNVLGTTNRKRLVPDFSFDADPNTGVSVFDTTPCQGFVNWMVFGGTSVAAPSLAGIINLAKHNLGSSELATVYKGYGSAYPTNFRDITAGQAGSNRATTNYDLVTGIGSSLGIQGK
jgi:subtilase family serine protease